MKDQTTSEHPLLPIGAGDTEVQPPQSDAADEAGSRDRSAPARDLTATALEARLAAARGRPVRLGNYHLIHKIGAGGMGVVFEAVHVTRRERMALKTLRHLTGRALYRFKQEFRGLADVRHENLVSYHELGCEDGEWFFTMEYVDGASFAAWTQDAAEPRSSPYLGVTMDVGGDDAAPPSGVIVTESRRAPRPRPSFHEARLRAALRELATGVSALHAAGKLHRDLNPANVLVTAEGRVVVLDFGLICDDPRAAARSPTFEGVSGTPGYMSPEQAAGKRATPASDWYGVGVMLFEALTGQLPFHGGTLRMLAGKQQQEAPRASSLCSGVPGDLDDLCAGLLSLRPEARPDADAVLRRLSASARPPRVPVTALIGRRAELAALERAHDAARCGRPTLVVVQGSEGAGKTALVERFAEQAALEGGALVLRGAVGPRESIPRRAVDPLVDALSAHLSTLPDHEARALLPPGARTLCRLFPVLECVGAMAEMPSPPALPPAELERAAQRAFGEIIARLAASAPLLLWVDDAEHARDEGAWLTAALSAPRAGAGAPLLILSGARVALPGLPAGEWISLDPLPPSEARSAARDALRRAGAGADRAPAIAHAAGGNPKRIVELAAWAAGGGRDAAEISLAGALSARLDALPDPAARLAEVLAAARAPIPQALAFGVAGLATAGPSAAARALVGAGLARADGPGDHDALAVRDEHARAAILERTAALVRARIHQDLADALAAWPGADPAITAEHLALAGRLDAATEHAARAADLAAARGDHDRAAALYACALDTASREETSTALGVRRAEALSAAGRSVEAARAFLGAAARAPEGIARDLRRCAAEELVRAGRFEDGLALLRSTLGASGLRYPSTSRAAVAALATRLAELGLRGTTIPPWAERAAGPTARSRIELAWSAGKCLASLDPLRAAGFMVEALHDALVAGDLGLAARGLAIVGTLLCCEGDAAQEARGASMIHEAARLAHQLRDPYLAALARACQGAAAVGAGRFREGLSRLREGRASLEARARHGRWEIAGCRSLEAQALLALGSLRERTALAEARLEAERGGGDRLVEAEVTLHLALGRLAGGDPRAARALARDALDRFGGLGFTTLHHQALLLEVGSLLHEGEDHTAWARLERAFPDLRRAGLLRIRGPRTDALHLRGITAAAAGAADPAALAIADDAAIALARERAPHAIAASALVRAAAAHARGLDARAAEELLAAAAGYDAAEMTLFAAAARLAAASLPGRRHHALADRAEATLRAEGIRSPARWARMLTGVGG